MTSRSELSSRGLFTLGFGFLGISLLWGVYNDFVPVILQAGRADFARGAGIRGYGLDIARTGFVMGLDNLAAIFILPYVGGLSDRVRTKWGRRKPFIAIGAPIAAVSFALAPLAVGGPIGWFMAALVVTLLAMDLFRTPVVALMPDLTPPHKRSAANGIINFMGGLGVVLAAQIGGGLSFVSPAAPFLFAAAGMLVSQGVLLVAVREPAQPEDVTAEDTPSVWASLAHVFRDRDRSAITLLAAIALWFLGQSALDAWFVSFSLQTFQITTGAAVQLKGTFALSILLSSVPCGLIGARWGRKPSILAGLLLFGFAILIASGVREASDLRIILAAAGFGWMLVVVNSLPLVLDFAPRGREGTYTGLYYIASQTAAFVGPMLSGGIFEAAGRNYQPLCVYTPAALFLAALLLWRVRPRSLQPD